MCAVETGVGFPSPAARDWRRRSGMHASLIALPGLLLVACSSPRETVPSNVAEATVVRVAPTDPLGWIGLATVPARTDELAYIPVNAAHPLVVPVADHAAPAGTVSVVGMRGTPTPFTAGAKTQIRFGCEDNQLDVIPFAGPRLPPGPAWILPPNPPPTWAPAPLAITQTRATPAASQYAIGPLTLDLARTQDPLRGTLTITRDGRKVHTAPFERQLMDGAEPSMATLDLSEYGPGIPTPVGAWAIAADGPFLLAVLQPGWEGVTLAPLLVDDAGAHPIEAMTMYLYYCAF